MSASGGGTAWHLADVWELVAEVLPDAPATIHGDRHQTWAQLDRRADAVAAGLVAAGLGKGGTVAQYLHSCPEYVETVFACFKLGLAPVNTNYRYAEEELAYLWGNAACGAVVFHGTYADRVDAVRPRVPSVLVWVWVDDGSGPCPEWATPYEDLASTPAEGRTVAPWGRSPDDLYLLYTGGTTGMPKGVMWRLDDLFASLNPTAAIRYDEHGGMEGARAKLEARGGKPGPAHVPCAPLMHGTGAFTSFAALSSGGSVVTLESRSFSAPELLDVIEREGVKSIAIVGDAFAKPILAALDADPERWDLSSLRIVSSSGVMWSHEVKQGLLRHNPRLLLVDSLGSSEAIGMASSVASADAPAATASFQLSATTRVLNDDGKDVVPGSGEVGVVALAGRGPVGYWGDEEKSAKTFRMVDGVRHAIPGDMATVDADGTLRLLGRGSVCINTGGEKVYPEEVEEVIKTHPAVLDAVCVGVPDDRFGEAITALVEARPGEAPVDADVIAHVKGRLAAYKAPKRVFVVDSIGRAPNGKVDYGRWKREAASLVSNTPT